MLTGVNDTRLVGQYVEWNNQTEIKGWGSWRARRISGTGGFLFHPGVTRHENLTVFVDELYRFVCVCVCVCACMCVRGRACMCVCVRARVDLY